MYNQLISVIVPVFNVEKYLSKCIDSILNQTYKNLEIILVNDGSKDSCAEICENYAKLDDRIRVIHKENGGLSSARNAGLKIAKGEFIGFVDSDDWVDKDMYEILISKAIHTDADIVECKIRYIFKDHSEGHDTLELIECDNITALNYFLSNYRFFKPVVVNKLYKRKIFNNLNFKEGYIHEDGFFTYQALFSARKILYIGLTKYNYLQGRDGSIMTENFGENRLVILEAFKERTSFLEDKGYNSLAKKSFEEYLGTLLMFYINAKTYTPNNYKLQAKIKEEIVLNYKNITKMKNSLKVRFFLFKLHPDIFILSRKFIIFILKKRNVRRKN
ncbi:glycosyltransferase [Neobacillus kokaensis]|uniref:Glycosyltransferase 2-like domain-containing protein n=1 Tax=Neobacillus kokaensis TaxID=2759023 RepID=A0ABQ3N3G0_9BACI|nr:glycosyltransferase [Neobacillus kokaensis]GHH98659.1 hypothetical protein AM1BK_22020 [Neobacillus kokaensis]